MNIFCEIFPYNKVPQIGTDVKALIISGSPFSVRDNNAPEIDYKNILGKLPMLGVCYGAQYLAQKEGGRVERSEQREYGKAILNIETPDDPIFSGIPASTQVWMSHGDSVLELPPGYTNIATTEHNKFAMFKKNPINDEAPVYAVQFHPEVTHSSDGLKFLGNFLLNIANIKLIGRRMPSLRNQLIS